MGFDQYHEPPEELPPATRTFARLCASLTEEAEAIGWYEQRIAVETDPEALAVMRDAQGEEFKHFSMDLEFLLRRVAGVARDRRGRPVPARRHRRARRGGRGRDARGGRRRRRGRLSRRLARDRQPEGSAAMNHLLRSLAPISDSAWKELDDEARERLAPGARRPQARRLLGAPRLGVLGHEPRARGRARVGSVRRGDRSSATRAAAGRGARAASSWRSSELRRHRPRRRRRRPRAARQRRAPDRRGREQGRLPWLEGSDGGDRRGISAQAESSSATSPMRTGGRWRRRSSACCTAGSAARTGSRSAARSTSAWSRAPSTAAIRCSSTCARSSTARSSGPPGVGGAVVVSLRGGDFVFESGAGPLDRLRGSTTPRPSACIWRRASASTSPRRRPRWRSPHLAADSSRSGRREARPDNRSSTSPPSAAAT